MNDEGLRPDADTEPVLMKEDTRVEFTSAVVPAGAQREIALRLEQAMPKARIFASTDPRDRDGLVVLLGISCGGVPLHAKSAPAESLRPESPTLKSQTLESLRFGMELEASLAEGVEVVFEVYNKSSADTRVGVSIVTDELVRDRG